jgi:hypothetical protein
LGLQALSRVDFAPGGRRSKVGAGQGKGLYGAVRVVVAERLDDSPHGGARGKDIVDQEERGGIGFVGERVGIGDAGDRGCNLIDILDLGSALPAAQVFVREGRAGFVEEIGEVTAAKTGGKRMAKEVEGGGEVHTGSCFVVAEGADNNGVGGKGQEAEQFGGAVDPGIEVGLDTLFEFDEAMGKRIFSGCQGEIGTEKEVGEVSIPAFYFGSQQPHDLDALRQNYKRSGGRSGEVKVGLVFSGRPGLRPWLGYDPDAPARQRSPSRSTRRVSATMRIEGSGKRKRSLTGTLIYKP